MNEIKNNINIFCCGKKRCMTCCDGFKPNFVSTVTEKKYCVINHTPRPLTCSSSNIIYLISCSRCGIQYVGETEQTLRDRMNGHRYTVRKRHMILVAEHFAGHEGCNMTHFRVQPIEQILVTDKSKMKSERIKRENFWIKELRTLTPYGLNDRLDHKNWRYRSREDIACKVFNHLPNKRGNRGMGTQKRLKTKLDVNFNSDKFLNELKTSYDNVNNWRALARKTINSLKLSVIRDLSWIVASHYYNANTTIPKEVTNLTLDLINYRLFLDNTQRKSKTKHTNVVKVFFQSPDVEKLGLASLFRKHSNLIPSTFNIQDSPTLIYSRSKTIGSTIFNYKETVDNVMTNGWKHGNSEPCNCQNSEFCDPHHGHVITGDLRFIRNRKLRSLLQKGPKYREPANVKWLKVLKDVTVGLKNCIDKWAQSEKVETKLTDQWRYKVLYDIKANIRKLSKKETKFSSRRKSILNSQSVKSHLKELQEKFVFVPTDKAGNNIAVICKKFYIEQSLKELGIFVDSQSQNTENQTYKKVDGDVNEIIKKHREYLKDKVDVELDKSTKFPFLYWIPKMHKKPHSKQRFIAASYDCTTKPISAILTKCFKLIEKQHRFICRRYEKSHRINPMWIIHNSSSVHMSAANFNRTKTASDVRTYDFTNLYTSIPHNDLRIQLRWVIKEAFKSSKYSFISVYKNDARWTNSPRKNTLHLNCNKVIILMNWLIDNIYVTFGDKCFRQVIGIPMGTDCAPFLANLFLYAREYKWIDKQRKLNNWHVLKHFRSCSRYIDDLLLFNNSDQMKVHMSEIYPKELILVPDETNGKSCPFLDLNVDITDRIISTSIYDKRDAFNFPIVNFPNLSGNIPKKSSCGVFIGELVRYARACSYFEDFESRTLSLVGKLIKQNFTPKLLKSTWHNFCNSHIMLVQKYDPRVIFLFEKWM